MLDFLTANDKEAYRNGFAYAYGAKAEYGAASMLRRVREAARVVVNNGADVGSPAMSFAAGAIDAAMLIVCKARGSEIPREIP